MSFSAVLALYLALRFCPDTESHAVVLSNTGKIAIAGCNVCYLTLCVMVANTVIIPSIFTVMFP